MTDTLVHRGPDDSGICLLREGRVGLGNRRLSILDLSSAGHQPMSCENDYWITYNGEVYNFLELRNELQKRGHTFVSQTDTEVILKGYVEWGVECLDRFNGMFAFAIWDEKQQRLFLARDRMGIKPLYYTTINGRFLFSSEVKAFFVVPGFDRRVNSDALISTLLFLWNPYPATFFEDVYLLPPGHYMLAEKDTVKIRQYWDIPLGVPEHRRQEEWRLELREILGRAVRRNMISDVPVGILLSGGLDSSSVTACASELGNPVRTYSIVFRDSDQQQEAMPDDAAYARVVAKHFGTHHQEIYIDPDIAGLLPKILWHLDEPLADPAAINTYLISGAAKGDGTTVLLSGMGGDEIFGGYRKYLATVLSGYYRKIPEQIRRIILSPAIRSFQAAGKTRGYRWLRWAKRFEKNASQDHIECFIGNSSYYNLEELQELLQRDGVLGERLYGIDRYLEVFTDSFGTDEVNRMCYVDSKLFLSNLNLMYMDKATMAASVEGRPPLLDHELVEFAFRIPGNLKIHRFTQKYIFKKALEGYLPKEVIYRPKSPFGAPLRSWTRGQLLPMINDLYSESAVKRRGLFNYQSIRKMIDDNTSGREDYAHRLWALLTLEIWFQQFMDRPMRVTRSDKIVITSQNAQKEGSVSSNENASGYSISKNRKNLG